LKIHKNDHFWSKYQKLNHDNNNVLLVIKSTPINLNMNKQKKIIIDVTNNKMKMTQSDYFGHTMDQKGTRN